MLNGSNKEGGPMEDLYRGFEVTKYTIGLMVVA